ncbi:Myb-like DNA-binding domain containing protein [Histomonas meleagridis]|uniref:Myb-like DNA-binding domain containing protein n=1 Tax=Histomonas meleagridis TaxID=135588 RepID=UPI00355AC1E5|nr:Myb-like DNA-binding domain containing protein [Histomonas meleagridis]KAH0798030.1 Myb-like DNA-binding domain containing protein [Histomonas meleagridis]
MGEQLKLEDVEFLIPPPPPGLDPAVVQYVQNVKIKNKLIQIKLVNENLDELYRIYPKGNPVLFFIAYEMCSGDIAKLLDALKVPNFIIELYKQAENLGFDATNMSKFKPSNYKKIELYSSPQQQTQQKESTDESESSSSEEDDDSYENSGSPHSAKHWSEEEKMRLISICENLKVIRSWEEVAERIGKKPFQIKTMVLRMKNNGLLKHVKIDVQKGRKQKREGQKSSTEGVKRDELRHIAGILFCYDNDRSYVGDKSYKLVRYMIENPLFGYKDPITTKMLTVPVMSEFGTVLNYETWIKILKDDKIDPFIRLPVSKRDLKFLTAKNFPKYKDLIKNLELK